jgi:hypothetical protein
MNYRAELELSVRGNDELGITLELPYLKESPADVIITNDGHHYLLAYKIRWEGIKFNGEIVERQSIGCHDDAFLENDPEKRKELLIRCSLIPPNTKWFAGLGREHLQIIGAAPTLEEVGRDPELFPDIKEYRKINVTLDAVMLESGQVVGRDPAAFYREINTIVAENLEFQKEVNRLINWDSLH